MDSMQKSAYLLLACLLANGAAASASENVTIQGKDLYLDGKPWLPKGVDVEAFARPAIVPSAPKWVNVPAESKKWWGAAELAAIKREFGANVARFQFSQPALDPKSPVYDPKYLETLLSAIQLGRAPTASW